MRSKPQPTHAGSAPDISPLGAPLPPKKPLVMARRVSLFEREIRVSLSNAALEILFELSAILSEGEDEAGGYFGSTMITIDLQRATALVSEPCDAVTVKRVAELLSADPRVQRRARAIAAAEADRLATAPLVKPQIDLRVRGSGHHLYLDLDVQAAAPAARPTADKRISR